MSIICYIFAKIFAMIDIEALKEELILQNLDQLDKQIDTIREECILSYLSSFIGRQNKCFTAYAFESITKISHQTIYNVLERKVQFGPLQRRRWCLCIWANWDFIVKEMKRFSLKHDEDFNVETFKNNFRSAFEGDAMLAEKLEKLGKLRQVIDKYQSYFSSKVRK